jgi:hypothetical protein
MPPPGMQQHLFVFQGVKRERVCVCERESESEREREGERGREKEREGEGEREKKKGEGEGEREGEVGAPSARRACTGGMPIKLLFTSKKIQTGEKGTTNWKNRC